MPSLRNGRAQALMCHCKSDSQFDCSFKLMSGFLPDNQVLVRSMLAVAVDPDDKWFSYSVTDPALFHSAMLHSAAHNAMLAGNTDLADPVSLKWEAIKLVNDRLGDPVLGLSDVTIGAVVALLLFEVGIAEYSCLQTQIIWLTMVVNIRTSRLMLKFRIST